MNETEEQGDNDEPKSGWVAMWQGIVTVIFILCCFAYCTRREWVQIFN